MLEIITGRITNGIPPLGGLLLCTACSLVFGLGVAWSYMFRSRYSKGLAVTLVLVPAVVQVVIMLVNGSLGAGLAVAGAFSLVRFRSIPGNARDIGALFFAMALGLVCGMGYLFYAFMLLLLIGGANGLLTLTHFGQGKADNRVLRVTIPESLDFEGLFDEIFEKYTREAQLDRVKTTGMGSLFELTYAVRMKPAASPKAFIDELRCRNGNLNISLGRELPEGEL